jgi:predicted lactoylglutathione lyase
MLGAISPLLPAGEDVTAAAEFYGQLGFEVVHQEGNPPHMVVLRRDQAEIFLVKNSDRQLAEGMALRIYASSIEALYAEFQAKGGAMLHPNDPLQVKPWGVKEFSIIDLAGVCITFYEPQLR